MTPRDIHAASSPPEQPRRLAEAQPEQGNETALPGKLGAQHPPARSLSAGPQKAEVFTPASPPPSLSRISPAQTLRQLHFISFNA